jgi:ribonuclease VapC
VARVVFDASAALAVIRDEVGANTIWAYCGEGLISAVNLQEVVKTLLWNGIGIDLARRYVDDLHLDTRSHQVDDAYHAAQLVQYTSSIGSGIGDRSCLALAIAEGLPALTTDRAWSRLTIPGLQVILAR